ncbi:ribose-phosphate pyrophosphokinase [Coxiella endosymbiont of Amblyomma nuttalli]|uniref:ribose-phosphate pyrophosphokinase n=1 Tax=Coxiella endosymbiont of Amblyomma nuttalli TaxID=2749996 RepID=UPI001BACDDA0|nr:ribose-phosphate pyrophosphokinase [Coxiella endosymbiont of Amblyomma nuttalli]QTS84208.1 Ribose-phosphate pyrophosphokinase [Coxiella endosymbiont of Amblyomma nuttalli]
MSSFNDIRIFHGSANPDLGTNVAKALNTTIGHALVTRFSDGEIRIEIQENVRGRDIYLIQSTGYPVNENVMELLFMADAFRRASAKSITAVVPYFGYARQDRRVRSSRVPISAKVIADMMQKVGFSRLITVDLHADQIQGFFYMPVDNIYASITALEQYGLFEKLDHPMIVSPDVGGVVRARAIAKRLNDSDLAIIDKRRPSANQAEVMNVIGRSEGRHCVIVDDIVDTAGTLCQAAKALKNKGALTVSSYCTHPVLSGNSITNIMESDIDELVVTDTIPLNTEAMACGKIKQISLSHLIAETISRINQKESVSSMFLD